MRGIRAQKGGAMGGAQQELFTREGDQDRWAPAKFSEVILEFAAPLLTLDPDGPPDIDALRSVMTIASLCWNAPLAEVQGDRSLMQQLQPILVTAPDPVAGVLRQMLSARLTRYAGVPHMIIAEVTGSTLDDARCVARALARNGSSTAASSARRLPGATTTAQPIAPTSILPLSFLFPELAEQEQVVWHVAASESGAGLPAGTYVLRERYCADRGCDCRRVMLYVEHVEGGRVIATIGYGFEPPAPAYAHFERQIELDWLNPQSEFSEAALRRFEEQLAGGAAYRTRWMQHYARWKRVVDDRKHPLHTKLRSLREPTQGSPTRTGTPKVGANALCPCGSGGKYKRCCRT
jgi:hypothetical protein